MHKHILTGLTAAALALSTSAAAFAGGFAETDIEPEVFVVEEAAAASFNPLFILPVVALIPLLSDDDEDEATCTIDCDGDIVELR